MLGQRAVGRGVGWQARLGVDWMGAVGVAAACKRRVTAAAAPSPFLRHPFLEGPSLRPPSPNRAAESRGVTHVREGTLGW